MYHLILVAKNNNIPNFQASVKFMFKGNVQFICITRFGFRVSHLLVNKDVCATPVVFQSQATVQCKLHSIDPEIFPLLETTDIPVSIC